MLLVMTQKTFKHTLDNELHTDILKLCHKMELPIHFNTFGPKVFTNYQRVALIILYLRSGQSLRTFVERLYESRWPQWLGLREIPGKSTLHDWMKLFKLTNIRELNNNLLADKQPSTMAIDATGIDSWKQSRHYEKRCVPKNMRFAKLDVFVDVETMLIHDHTLRLKPRHDVLGARTMLSRTTVKHALVLADKGYDCEWLHRLAQKKQLTLFAPVRASPRTNPKGFFRRKCVNGHPKQGRRSLVESTIRSLKAKKASLRARLPRMKKREMAWAILMHNFERLHKTVQALLSHWLSMIPD